MAPTGGEVWRNPQRISSSRGTESDVAELQSFVDEDMSVEEIARELGRTVEAVRAKAAEEGISLLPSTAMGDLDE
jgi:hypothetical protein